MSYSVKRSFSLTFATVFRRLRIIYQCVTVAMQTRGEAWPALAGRNKGPYSITQAMNDLLLQNNGWIYFNTYKIQNGLDLRQGSHASNLTLWKYQVKPRKSLKVSRMQCHDCPPKMGWFNYLTHMQHMCWWVKLTRNNENKRK